LLLGTLAEASFVDGFDAETLESLRPATSAVETSGAAVEKLEDGSVGGSAAWESTMLASDDAGLDPGFATATVWGT
jgi:hypothetical protein